MITLDTTTDQVMAAAPGQVEDFCRTKLRLVRQKHPTLRELMSRRGSILAVQSVGWMRDTVWDQCDGELQAAITAYLEDAGRG